MTRKPINRRDALLETASAFYTNLCKTGFKASADSIWRACNLIEEVGEGKTRITLNAVARICVDEFGGPKAQSIRNQPDTLKKLISLRADAMSLAHVAPDSMTGSFVSSDPNASAYITILSERLRQTERSNNRLRSVLKNLSPNSFALAESEELGMMLVPTEGNDDSTAVQGLTYAERDSLRAFLKPSQLARFGLSIDDMDRITEGQSVLMEGAAVRALRRLGLQ